MPDPMVGRSGELHLVEATPAHATLLGELHRRGFAGDEHLAIGNLVSLIDGPGIIGLIATEGDDPAGFVLLRQVTDEVDVLTIVVLPAWRRRGIAAALLGAALRRACAQGGSAAFLEVAEDNAPARALYAGMGFRQVGRRTHYYGQGRHAALLRLDFAQPAPGRAD